MAGCARHSGRWATMNIWARQEIQSLVRGALRTHEGPFAAQAHPYLRPYVADDSSFDTSA